MVQISSFCRSCLAGLAGLLVLLLIAGGGPRVATAQTPTTTIQNGNNDTRLQLNYDGGLLIPGTFGPTTPADSIPATGAGTRLMWYPAKAALRAGRVGASKDGTQWDATKVGRYSAALGVDTKASGNAATAMGSGTTASGNGATAMGSQTTATDDRATAMGFQTTASGDDATAMGNSTTASAPAATAMGTNTEASFAQTTAMGLGTTARTRSSLSLGTCNSANTSRDNTLLAVGNGSYDFGSDNCSSTGDALELQTDGDLVISGTLFENSDRRLKTDIEPLDEGVLHALQDIRPVRYRFKNQNAHPSSEHLGLLAQDVQKEFPELVSEGSDGMLSLSYTNLSAVLLKGLQEQQSTIDQQEGRIAELEDRLTALEAEGAAPSVAASLMGSWGLALLLGLGGLAGGLLWRRSA